MCECERDRGVASQSYIDGSAGCTDIDDALHVRPLPNGNYEVGVHIADVSHFVRPGSALDKEAAKRGTTVYLSNRRYKHAERKKSKKIIRKDRNRETKRKRETMSQLLFALLCSRVVGLTWCLGC